MSQPHHIKEWRKFRGMTQEELASRIDTSKAVVSRIESGQQRYNQQIIEAMAAALQCSPGDLIVKNPLQPDPWEAFRDRLEAVRGTLDELAREAAPPLTDEQVEGMVLGAMLYDNLAAQMAWGVLGKWAFTHPVNAAIYEAIEAALGEGRLAEPLDIAERLKEHPSTLANASASSGELIAYLSDLVYGAPGASAALDLIPRLVQIALNRNRGFNDPLEAQKRRVRGDA